MNLNYFSEPPPPPDGFQVLEVSSQTARVSWQIQSGHPGTLDQPPDQPRISKYIIEVAEVHGEHLAALLKSLSLPEIKLLPG